MYKGKDIYIFVCVCLYSKWYYFCRKVSVNARNYFSRKVSVNARKLKRWVILPFLSNIHMSPKIVHPRYFCSTSWLHQKFPLVILALLLCFLPSLFLLVAPLSLLWLSQALGHPISSLALIFHGYTHKSKISAHFALFFS